MQVSSLKCRAVGAKGREVFFSLFRAAHNITHHLISSLLQLTGRQVVWGVRVDRTQGQTNKVIYWSRQGVVDGGADRLDNNAAVTLDFIPSRVFIFCY